MRLTQVRVQNYRCVRDTGWFDVEQAKTILVGPNEAGKTAVLEALQRINPPDGVRGFDPLRDYPRKLYSADIQSGRLDPKSIPVTSAQFELGPDDLAELPDGFGATGYRCTRCLNNRLAHGLQGGPEIVVFSEKFGKISSASRPMSTAMPLKAKEMRHRDSAQDSTMSLAAGRLGQPALPATVHMSCEAGEIRSSTSSTRKMRTRIHATRGS